MVVFSRFPIDMDRARTFQTFLWKDMPGAIFPIDRVTKKAFYSDPAKQVFRLSSKSHWDIPIRIADVTVHFVVAHPTPPVFDGAEDRNGRRNHDEIRLLADYVDPKHSEYIYDDLGRRGGLAAGERFVIAGDLNADPVDGDSTDRAIWQLLDHPLINASFVPASKGGQEAGQANHRHRGDPSNDTADFDDERVGNLRIDYVLPSKNLEVVGGGVFWPRKGEEGCELVDASDHRLVWLDIAVSK
jgi:hypothetical protein